MTDSTNKILRLARVLVAAIVVVAIAITIAKAWGQFAEQPIEISKINWKFIALASLCYVAAMSTGGIYWVHVLRTFGHQLPWNHGLGIFFASQLGKYVPGKAMVVVIRSGQAHRLGVPLRTGAASVFIETFTWISVGAIIGASILAFILQDHGYLVTLAIITAMVAAIPTLPPVMRRILKLFRFRPDTIPGLQMRDLGIGWLVLTVGWVLSGVSLWCVYLAVPGAATSGHGFVMCLASVCLATVLGFISPLPGGIGVRELVMVPFLSPLSGMVPAVTAVVLMRLVWIGSEMAIVAIMYGGRSRRGAVEVIPTKTDHLVA